MAVDDSLIGALHVQAMRAADLPGAEPPHETFQASTIAALLDGAYDGDVSFAELARHGDLGLGTLDGCDGEMIAIDGQFLRADVDGAVHPVPPHRQDAVRGPDLLRPPAQLLRRRTARARAASGADR